MHPLILGCENRGHRFAAGVECQHAVEVGFLEYVFAAEGVESGDLARVGHGDHVGPEADERAVNLVEADVCGMWGVGEDPAGSGEVGEVAEEGAGDVGEGQVGGCGPG